MKRELRCGIVLALLWVLGGRGPCDGAQSPVAPAAPAFQRREGGWWWIEAPGRPPLFSVGINVTDPGLPRDRYDPENPSYAPWRHHADTAAWAREAVDRLRRWRFTTLGAWTHPAILAATNALRMHLTPVLHIGASAGAPWWDMWDRENVRRMERVAREAIAPTRGDPRVLGYYSDNELGWWNASLWKHTLEQPASSGQRQRVVRLVQETYGGDWSRLVRDFEPEHAGGWRELGRGGMLYLRPGGEGVHVMRRALELLADRYYSLMRTILARESPGTLFLGDRYPSFYYPEVARAAARQVDAVSINVNAAWVDGTFPRFQLDTLHAMTAKPVLVTEFYLSARENRSGTRNTSGPYMVVDTQAERATAARTTLERLCSLPYVVGVDWFQYADEPMHGRADGENFNFGLVDHEDRPYDSLTEVFAQFDPARHRSLTPSPRPDVSGGVPPAPRDPWGDFTPGQALRGWDRERGFIPCSDPLPVADLYACWSRDALHLGMYYLEWVEPAYYRDKSIPKEDRAMLWLQLPGGRGIRLRVGAGREALASDSAVRVTSVSSVNSDPRNWVGVEIPAPLLGHERLDAGDRVSIECLLTTHAGGQRQRWSRELRLAR